MRYVLRVSAGLLVCCLILQPVLAVETAETPAFTETSTSTPSHPIEADELVPDALEVNLTDDTTLPETEVIPMPETESASSSEATLPQEVIPATETLPVIIAEHVPGEVLVKFKDGSLDLEKRSGEALAEEIVTTNEELKIDETIPDANIAVVDTGALDAAEAIVVLEADPDVEYAEPNYIYRIEAIDTDDTHRALMWALENTGQAIGNGVSTTTGTVDSDIDAPEAWALSRGAGVIVAVIDTGVDYTHPDLEANMWDGGSCLDETGATLGNCIHGYDFYRNSLDPAPDYDHGTHVAGTIAAAINNGEGTIGVAPEASIMALRTDFQSGSDTVLSTAAIVRAIDFARYNGAKVINASFGGAGVSLSMQQAIADFGDAGGIFIAASGNTTSGGIDTDVTPFYPASYDLPNVIAVAASNQSDALASFSNYGAVNVDLSAPGTNIASAVPGGYGYKNGTSMATPHVAGVAAQLFAYDPTLSIAELRAALLEGDTIAGQTGSTTSGKRLNAFGAMESLNLATTSTLTVEVAVVNDHTGTATSSDFTFSINSAAAQSVATTTSTTTLSSTINPGRYYTVTGTAASGYDLSSSNCSDIVAAAGATATCTLTYNDIAPVVSSGGGGGGGGGGSSKKKKKTKVTEEKTTAKTPVPTKTITKTPALSTTSAPMAPRFVFDRIVGAQGTDVTELQRTLAAKGYLGVAPTGYFGTLTSDALRRYQAANMLPATGVLDAATRVKLNAEVQATPVQAATGTQSATTLQAQITFLQQQLAALLAQLATSKKP